MTSVSTTRVAPAKACNCGDCQMTAGGALAAGAAWLLTHRLSHGNLNWITSLGTGSSGVRSGRSPQVPRSPSRCELVSRTF